MRVVVVTPWEPWRAGDGAVLPLHHHLHELAPRHELVVLAAGSTATREQRFTGPAQTLPDGVTLRWFGTSRPRALDYGMRRVAAMRAGEPAHVRYVERPELVRALRSESTQADLVYLAGWGTAALARHVAAPAVHAAVDPWAAAYHDRRLPWVRRITDLGERRLVARHEKRWYPEVGAVVVVTAENATVLGRLTPTARIEVVANGVDAGPDPAPLPGAAVVGFHGSFATEANVAGARALVSEVLPDVRAARPDVRAVIVGRDPPASVLGLRGDGVEVHPNVDDVRGELERMDVYVAWMTTGHGMKNKVLEAMAAGRPVVTNQLGAAGIGAGPGIFVEADARMAAERVLQLLEDPAAARQAGADGRSRVLRHHSWVASARRLEQVWCDVAIPTR